MLLLNLHRDLTVKIHPITIWLCRVQKDNAARGRKVLPRVLPPSFISAQNVQFILLKFSFKLEKTNIMGAVCLLIEERAHIGTDSINGQGTILSSHKQPRREGYPGPGKVGKHRRSIEMFRRHALACLSASLVRECVVRPRS